MSLTTSQKTKFDTLQSAFFERYPQGFDSEEFIAIRKKHNVDKTHDFAVQAFAEEKFSLPGEVVPNMVKVISRSSMVSLFEKPRFRDAVAAMSNTEREDLAYGLQGVLHGDAAAGFEQMVGLLVPHKLAKWSLMSAWPFYFDMGQYFFIKPTVTKQILAYFDVTALKYTPKANYPFYAGYQDFLRELKAQADPRLQLNNAAFTGFFMMSLQSN